MNNFDPLQGGKEEKIIKKNEEAAKRVPALKKRC